MEFERRKIERVWRSGDAFSGKSTTVFVDNLPFQIRKIWVYNLFSRFGKIRNLFISNKRSKISGQSFAFVSYLWFEDAEAAISNTNNSWYWNHKLVVKFPRFLKEEDVKGPHRNSLSNFSNKSAPWSQRRNHRQEHGNPSSNFTPLQYSQTRTDGGRENRYNNGGFTQLKELEKRVTVYLQPTASEWLWRSAIADLKEVSTPEIMQKAFSDLKFKDVQVRSMGGKFMLITFQNVEDRNNALVNHVIKGWFHSLKHWKGDAASLSRLIWLKIRGMPLNAWELKSFKKIAEYWGEFLILDQETLSMDSFDVGRLLMVTNCKHKIDEWINVIVKGRNYQVQVWEEECNNPFDVKGVDHNDFQFCSINRPFHFPAKDVASHVDIHSKDKIVGEANSVHKEVEKAVNQKDNFDNLETLAHDVPGGENPLLNSCDRYAMPDEVEKTADEVEKTADVGSKYGSHQDDSSYEEVANSKFEAGMPPIINEVATVMDSTDSSLGIENSMMGSDIVADSLEKISMENQPQNYRPNCVPNQDSELMVDDRSYVDKEKEIFNDKDGIDVDPFHEDLARNNANVINSEDHLDHFEANQAPIQAAIKGLKGKRNRKSIDEILGYTKVNARNTNGKRNNKKCVVLRSAVASAALSASISSGGINNRNKILLDEAQAIWAVDKLFGISYDGEEEEVVSKIAEMEARNKARATDHL